MKCKKEIFTYKMGNWYSEYPCPFPYQEWLIENYTVCHRDAEKNFEWQR